MVAASSGDAAGTSRTRMELQGERGIVITRTLGAPARIVFEAWTNPELVKRWWAPRSHKVSVASCEADVRAGGAYRYVLRRDSGEEMGFSGTYVEITPHSRLVYTQVFEPMAGQGEAVITVTFSEHDGHTHLVSHELYPSARVRDGVLASGMEHGMRETMDQLDELVATLR
jgi:uncharacterized protein YndB with AHSA1/START domain